VTSEIICGDCPEVMPTLAANSKEMERFATISRNPHPTIKPTALMRYLSRLITPPGGTILDPFMGSGSTGKAAALEGFSFIGIELSEEYCEIARRRIAHASAQPVLQEAGRMGTRGVPAQR